MSGLDYVVEPEVECPDDDPNDAAFVRAIATIGGHDAIEEYVVCKVYPLAAAFGFDSVTLVTTPMSKVETPLPMFAVENVTAKNTNRVLAERERDGGREGTGELLAEGV
jgi:hypothetical protein